MCEIEECENTACKDKKYCIIHFITSEVDKVLNNFNKADFDCSEAVAEMLFKNFIIREQKEFKNCKVCNFYTSLLDENGLCKDCEYNIYKICNGCNKLQKLNKNRYCNDCENCSKKKSCGYCGEITQLNEKELCKDCAKQDYCRSCNNFSILNDLKLCEDCKHKNNFIEKMIELAEKSREKIIYESLDKNMEIWLPFIKNKIKETAQNGKREFDIDYHEELVFFHPGYEDEEDDHLFKFLKYHLCKGELEGLQFTIVDDDFIINFSF